MINVSMDGVKDAVDALKEIVTPWRRKNAERMAKLDSVLRQTEIERANADTLIIAAKIAREQASLIKDKNEAELILSQAKKTEAEAALLFAQTEKVLAEADKERTAIKHLQIELAMKIIEKYSPNIEPTKKMDYVIKLIPILDHLTSNKIELK